MPIRPSIPVLLIRLIHLIAVCLLLCPTRVLAQFTDDDTVPIASDSGEWTLLVRLGIYATILVIAFCFFFLAGYRVMLSRDGVWPSSLYGWCLGCFLATSIVILWPLFGDKWIGNESPFSAYGPQILIVTGAVVALVFSVLLFRSRPATKPA